MSFSERPMVFVTGASRSGTTLVTQILGRHGEIGALREMQYFGEFCDPVRGDAPLSRDRRRDVIATLFRRQEVGIVAAGRQRSEDPYVDALLEQMPEHAGPRETFAATVAFLSQRQAKSMPCEQTPRNIYYARDLLDWYPQARLIHVLRDPRGVMASQKFRWRRRSLLKDPSSMSRRQQLRTWFNYHPYTVTRLWNLATRRALELEDHPRVHLMRFEDLVLEPESQLRGVCDFLGLEFEPGMLDIEHVNSSYVATAGAARGLNPAAIDAWRDKLSETECAVVERNCGPLMHRAGYPGEAAAMQPAAASGLALRYALHVGGALALNPRRLWIQVRGLRARRPAAPAPAGEDPRRGAVNGEAADSEAGAARRATVFGLPCVDTDPAAAARDLVRWARAQVGRRVAFVNAHSVNVSTQDPGLKQALERSDVIYADGVGMAMAARLHGTRLQHNVNGTDLFPHLCRQAEESGVALALLGAAPGVVDDCERVLAERYPGLRVAWKHHGYVAEADYPAVVDDINASGAGILLVAMGVPRQEQWIMQHWERLTVPVVMGVGGLFDFVSGRVPRAPEPVRRLRLEWLFRLAMEPRRLFGRYVLGNPAFLARACRYALTGHAGGTERQRVASR